jgi:hypothetical protein
LAGDLRRKMKKPAGLHFQMHGKKYSALVTESVTDEGRCYQVEYSPFNELGNLTTLYLENYGGENKAQWKQKKGREDDRFTAETITLIGKAIERMILDQ